MKRTTIAGGKVSAGLAWALFVLLCFGSIPSFASPPEQLKSFEAFLEALKAGRTVKAVFYYAKCRLVIDGKDEKAPDAVGGMEFRTFEYFAPGAVKNPKGFVAASETVLISHPRYGYVQNYVKVRIFEDHAVEIIARYLNPKTLKVVMDETFHGEIDDGTNGKGIVLYAADRSGD